MVTKYMGVDFTKDKYSAFTGETRVAFQELDGDFKIEATPQGIFLKGELSKGITSRDDLNDFARLITDAWKAHDTLRPKLVNLNGDNL